MMRGCFAICFQPEDERRQRTSLLTTNRI